MREIEIKARVKNKTELLAKIAAKGVALSEPKKQHDVVFCKPGQKDYEPGSIWLRIRTEDDKKVTWTMKVDTGRKLDSIEHEVDVSDGETLETMLLQLGNELYSDLTKTRQKAKIGDVEICVDTIDGLGTFIEAEKLCADDVDYETVAQELWGVLAEFGVARSDRETLGYDVLIKQQTA